jgi:hypothetical protein
MTYRYRDARRAKPEAWRKSLIKEPTPLIASPEDAAEWADYQSKNKAANAEYASRMDWEQRFEWAYHMATTTAASAAYNEHMARQEQGYRRR